MFVAASKHLQRKQIISVFIKSMNPARLKHQDGSGLTVSDIRSQNNQVGYELSVLVTSLQTSNKQYWVTALNHACWLMLFVCLWYLDLVFLCCANQKFLVSMDGFVPSQFTVTCSVCFFLPATKMRLILNCETSRARLCQKKKLVCTTCCRGRKVKVFIAFPNGHTRRQSEKPGVRERRDLIA